MNKYDIAVIGGDKRTAYAAGIFAKKGLRVICYGTVKTDFPGKDTVAIHMASHLKEAMDNTPVIVCGIPFIKKDFLYSEQNLPELSLWEFQRNLRKSQKVFAGLLPESFRRHCEERGISCFDLMGEEPFCLFQAIATAEGALLEALSHKDTLLHKSPTLVLGYGRCGKILADKLRGIGARVTVCSRSKEELALAEALGFSTITLSEKTPGFPGFEYVFNTVPACILSKEVLSSLRKDALIVDIASNRTGADYEAAQTLGIKILYCPGLPGKYSPESCAVKIADTVSAVCGSFM